IASTKLFATSESAVEKKPSERMTMVRSSSVKPFSDFHNAMSWFMLTSCGIQWFAHPSRYFCQAHSYLNGTSWFKSARQLIIRLSSTCTRSAPISSSSRPGATSSWLKEADAFASESAGFDPVLRGAGAGCAVATSGDVLPASDTTCELVAFCGSTGVGWCSGAAGFCESSSKSSQLRIDISILSTLLYIFYATFSLAEMSYYTLNLCKQN